MRCALFAASRRCAFPLDFSTSLNRDTGNDSPEDSDPHALGESVVCGARSHAYGESRGGALRSSPVLWVPVCHPARLVTSAFYFGDFQEESRHVTQAPSFAVKARTARHQSGN